MIKLISPLNNAIVDLVNDNIKSFCDAYDKQQKQIIDDYKFNGPNWGLKNHIDVLEFFKGCTPNRFTKPVEFVFENSAKSKLILSSDKDFNDKQIVKITKFNNLKMYNLLRNTKYYWKIVNLENLEESEIRSFTTSDYPRMLMFDKLLNVRDFGGYKTKSGKTIKQGIFYRGAEAVRKTYFADFPLEMNQETQTHSKSLSTSDIKSLKKLLKHGVELDFRSLYESNFSKASEISNEIEYLRFDGIGAYDYLVNPDNPKLIDSYNKIFDAIIKYQGRPIYCHCWGGADRTGSFCFLLGALLGMSYTDLVKEYELTTFAGHERVHYLPKTQYSWLRFYQFVESLQKYGVENNLVNQIDIIVEHLLINRYHISKDKINVIKDIFLR